MARRDKQIVRNSIDIDGPVGQPTENPGQLSGPSSDQSGNEGNEGSIGNGAAGIEGSDFGTGIPEKDAGEPGAKRRGRPKGSKNKPKEAPSSGTLGVDLGSLALQIEALHAIAAATTKMPELQLSSQEAKAIAARVKDITEYYGYKPSGPAMLWIGLAGTMAMAYVPRFIAIKARMPKRAKKPPSNGVTGAPMDLTGAGIDVPSPGMMKFN